MEQGIWVPLIVVYILAVRVENKSTCMQKTAGKTFAFPDKQEG